MSRHHRLSSGGVMRDPALRYAATLCDTECITQTLHDCLANKAYNV